MAHDMESRFYYFKGQTPDNTKISDRSHALHITGDSWNNITKHLDRKRLAKESLEKEERHKTYLDEGSKSMIKNWANSLENIRKRKDEERATAIENEKVERAKKFNELRKEQEEIRKAFVERANRNIFMNKGNAKQLTSAYILSEVLYEREKQKEFKKFLLQHEAEEYAKEVENIRRIAKEAAEEEKMYKEKERQKKLEVGKEMRKELAAKEEKAKAQAEKQKLIEQREYKFAMDEINCMKQKDLEMKLLKKQEMGKDIQEMLKNEHQKKTMEATEEQELDDVVRVYREAKNRIDCMRKAREKSLREDTIEIRRKMAEKAKAISNEAEVEAKRDQSLQKAIKEYEETEAQREQEKAELRTQGIRDKLESRKIFLENEEMRLKKEAELRKWEMLNRYKTFEIMDNFNKDVQKEQKQNVEQYREELLKQIADNKATQKKEEEMDRLVTEALIKTDDDKFYAYADEILHQERKTGRSTYPTEKAILGYKKNFNIQLPSNDDVRCKSYKLSKERTAMDIINQSEHKQKSKRKCKCQQKIK